MIQCRIGGMRKIFLFAILLLLIHSNIYSEEIPFPPELRWWLSEIQKVNESVEIEDFILSGHRTEQFNVITDTARLLVYPVFYRWNYFGDKLAYYNYHSAILRKQQNGKYRVDGFDDGAALFIANRNREIFFGDFFGLYAGIDSIHWLTDSVLVTVGTSGYGSEEDIDLFINVYTVDSSKNSVYIKSYLYENAMTFEEINSLALAWYEQRPDYFETRR